MVSLEKAIVNGLKKLRTEQGPEMGPATAPPAETLRPDGTSSADDVAGVQQPQPAPQPQPQPQPAPQPQPQPELPEELKPRSLSLIPAKLKHGEARIFNPTQFYYGATKKDREVVEKHGGTTKGDHIIPQESYAAFKREVEQIGYNVRLVQLESLLTNEEEYALALKFGDDHGLDALNPQEFIEASTTYVIGNMGKGVVKDGFVLRDSVISKPFNTKFLPAMAVVPKAPAKAATKKKTKTAKKAAPAAAPKKESYNKASEIWMCDHIENNVVSPHPADLFFFVDLIVGDGAPPRYMTVQTCHGHSKKLISLLKKDKRITPSAISLKGGKTAVPAELQSVIDNEIGGGENTKQPVQVDITTDIRPDFSVKRFPGLLTYRYTDNEGKEIYPKIVFKNIIDAAGYLTSRKNGASGKRELTDEEMQQLVKDVQNLTGRADITENLITEHGKFVNQFVLNLASRYPGKAITVPTLTSKVMLSGLSGSETEPAPDSTAPAAPAAAGAATAPESAVPDSVDGKDTGRPKEAICTEYEIGYVVWDALFEYLTKDEGKSPEEAKNSIQQDVKVIAEHIKKGLYIVIPEELKRSLAASASKIGETLDKDTEEPEAPATEPQNTVNVNVPPGPTPQQMMASVLKGSNGYSLFTESTAAPTKVTFLWLNLFTEPVDIRKAFMLMRSYCVGAETILDEFRSYLTKNNFTIDAVFTESFKSMSSEFIRRLLKEHPGMLVNIAMFINPFFGLALHYYLKYIHGANEYVDIWFSDEGLRNKANELIIGNKFLYKSFDIVDIYNITVPAAKNKKYISTGYDFGLRIGFNSTNATDIATAGANGLKTTIKEILHTQSARKGSMPSYGTEHQLMLAIREILETAGMKSGMDFYIPHTSMSKMYGIWRASDTGRWQTVARFYKKPIRDTVLGHLGKTRNIFGVGIQEPKETTLKSAPEYAILIEAIDGTSMTDFQSALERLDLEFLPKIPSDPKKVNSQGLRNPDDYNLSYVPIPNNPYIDKLWYSIYKTPAAPPATPPAAPPATPPAAPPATPPAAPPATPPVAP